MAKTGLTPYPELDEALIRHAAALKSVLRDNFTGLYAIGSLAIGDFDLTSDVDLTVITEDDLSDAELSAVQQVHRDTCSRDTRWVKHLEYSIFPKPMLLRHSSPYLADGRPNTAANRDLWYFNNGSTVIERSGHDNTVVTRWTLREKGVTVLGPEPATYLPKVSSDDLRREIRADLIGWGNEVEQFRSTYFNRFHQAFFVLNSCRVLQDLHEGRVTSKPAGVRWAKEHLDRGWIPLIDFCWQERQDTSISISQPADPEVFRRSMELVEYAAELARDYRLPS